MKNTSFTLARTLLAATLATALAGGAIAQTAPAPITVKIIGFNDFHGNLQLPGTFGQNTIVPRPSVRRSAVPTSSRPTWRA